MKIAIIADSLDSQNAGVHQYTKLLVEVLAKNENREHEYILIRQKKENHLPFEQIIIRNINIPIGYTALRLFFIIPLLLKKHRVDAVFEPAHFGPFNLPKKTKRITMIHDLTPIKFPHYHEWYSQFFQRMFLPRILRKADLILSNSENTRKDILAYQNLDEAKVKTILLGRDEFYYRVSSKDNLNTLKIKQPYFLSVGTIEPRKNLTFLLKEFEIFKKENESNVQLIIAGGNGWKTEIFHETLNNHPFRNEIRLLGFVTKEVLRELYSHAICLVYSSLYEGFGFPILEAMSCGTNVITSHQSSMPEVGGGKAFYFYNDEVGELKTLLEKMYKKEISYSQEDLLNQAQLFSWKEYVKEFENLLRDLV